MKSVVTLAHDLFFMSFMILSFVVPILFAGRLALALFSSDKIEACYKVGVERRTGC